MRLNSTVELSWSQSHSVDGSETAFLVISMAKTKDWIYLVLGPTSILISYDS